MLSLLTARQGRLALNTLSPSNELMAKFIGKLQQEKMMSEKEKQFLTVYLYTPPHCFSFSSLFSPVSFLIEFCHEFK